MFKKWVLQQADMEIAENLAETLHMSKLFGKLLALRQLETAEEAEQFLKNDISCLYDPFLLKDMDKAVARIKTAIENKESVCIYGDYDVDGVTATIILHKYLSGQGVNCSYFIPERVSDGYGVNVGALEKLADKVSLIITVDTGITAIEEAEAAKALGMDMIITDHHRSGDDIPDAVAVVDPHRADCGYPFKQLAGVGVVFKLICALSGKVEEILDKYGDIVALGTIADVMPIIDENRFISAYGLRLLKETSNTGLRALMECAGIIRGGKIVKKLNSTLVGYTIAPRINAAGRITSAGEAAELLLCDDYEQALIIAAKLCEVNKLRQTTEMGIFEQALLQIGNNESGDRVLVLSSDGWNQGVIGVVASKITEKFSLPSILFSFDGDLGKGSGRSIKGFSIMDALKDSEDLLIKFGGHELAAGLSIKRENIEEFRKRINAYAKANMAETDTTPVLSIDSEVTEKSLNTATAKEILKLEPFGLQNPQPVLAIRNMEISEAFPVGEGKHIKLKFKGETGACYSAIYFGMAYDLFSFTVGDKCDVAFLLELNSFYHDTDIQLSVKDIRPTMQTEETTERVRTVAEAILGDYEDMVLPHEALPTLDEFRTVFRFLKRDTQIRINGKRMSMLSMSKQIKQTENTEIKPEAIVTILAVLNEFKLADVRFFGNMVAGVHIKPSETRKVDLDRSAVLNKVRAAVGSKTADSTPQ